MKITNFDFFFAPTYVYIFPSKLPKKFSRPKRNPILKRAKMSKEYEGQNPLDIAAKAQRDLNSTENSGKGSDSSMLLFLFLPLPSYLLLLFLNGTY